MDWNISQTNKSTRVVLFFYACTVKHTAFQRILYLSRTHVQVFTACALRQITSIGLQGSIRDSPPGHGCHMSSTVTKIKRFEYSMHKLLMMKFASHMQCSLPLRIKWSILWALSRIWYYCIRCHKYWQKYIDFMPILHISEYRKIIKHV